MFKNSMIKPVCEKAGFGTPPSEYHNNCPECVIKMKVDRKKSALDEFCHKMKSLVQDQKNHLIRAVTSRGIVYTVFLKSLRLVHHSGSD